MKINEQKIWFYLTPPPAIYLLQVKDIQEQVKLMINAKQGMELNGIYGIEIDNKEILRLTPNEVNLYYNVKFGYNSQQIVAIGPMNVVC